MCVVLLTYSDFNLYVKFSFGFQSKKIVENKYGEQNKMTAIYSVLKLPLEGKSVCKLDIVYLV